jgi:hypothetical protein
MRDRHFITWLVGLIAVPVIFTAFPTFAATAAATVPILFGAAALIALVATAMVAQTDDEHSQDDNGIRWSPLRIHRSGSHQ